MYDINSKEYWNMRFTGNWQAASGRQQTAFFAQVALASCPGWFIEDLRAQKLSICDWGCALGDAIPSLRRKFPDNTIVGWDLSEIAIQEARKLVPHFTFHNGDLRHSDAKFDVIFSSNTLEHFHDPFAVMADVSAAAREYLWILVPFLDTPGIDEHFFRFEYENIRAWLAPDFLRSSSTTLTFRAGHIRNGMADRPR